MGEDNLVYICKGTKNLDFFRKEGIWGNAVDKLRAYFTELEDADLYPRYREFGDHEESNNLILGVTKLSLDFLIYKYTTDVDFGWSADSIDRGAQVDIVHRLMKREIVLRRTVNEEVQYHTIRPAGSLVILVDSSKLSRQGQPTVQQYAGFVQKFGGTPYIINETERDEIESVKPESWKDSFGSEFN
jgi:hypothetical protein